ncbi:uncharacterized protein LOC128206521 [Mya arenaria]|uniref:uncharacterized protein LOC128206521 n=1 Tax=Mya arenaria TaxID=6604 RepID=UPI0022E4A5E9|nr:uncharacterized protein LOC128206521 [Mya arenaria]XP_052765134.1 uncharacterized protein LOC128206521 [Mya arenaria]
MDLYQYLLVLLGYIATSAVCLLPVDPRRYPNKEESTSRQNLQVQMKELLNLAMIRADILRRLGITDPPLRPTPNPYTTKPPPIYNGIPFRLLDITRVLSESPGKSADTNIIQFKLSDIPSDNRTVVDMVNLLVRVKYKKKRKQERLDKLAKSSELRNTDTLSKKNKKKRRRKRNLEIELTVSNVTDDGKQGSVLTSVRSRLKKTKSLRLTLHPSVLERASNSDDPTLKLHIVCNGCGRRASLILLHRLKKRKATKRKGVARSLHKRRPVLFIQSHKLVTS